MCFDQPKCVSIRRTNSVPIRRPKSVSIRKTKSVPIRRPKSVPIRRTRPEFKNLASQKELELGLFFRFFLLEVRRFFPSKLSALFGTRSNYIFRFSSPTFPLG